VKSTQFSRPRRFDANLVVIGGGSAGLVSAYVAAAAKARVVLIEEHRMGGDCLNSGCVPSKALIRSARIASYLRRSAEFGLRAGPVATDFRRVMQRVSDVIARIEPHDSAERYTGLGVECVHGHATLRSPWEVEVGGRVITTRAIVLATGGRPSVPAIPGLADIDVLTSGNLWDLTELPGRLAVLGGGPIGCELAQAFRRLGSAVTLVEALPRLLSREDLDVGEHLAKRFAAEGIEVLAGWQAASASGRGPAGSLNLARNGEKRTIGFDRILVATGRTAVTAGLGLEQVGVALNPNGTIRVNAHLQTTRPTIYACGDVAGPYQLTHAAAHQAWYCATNALFGTFRKFRVDYSVLPWAVFTDPEVARVGVNEQEARQQGLPFEVTRYGIDDLDRAIAEGEAQGFVKVLTPPGSDRILGVTIVGPHAGDTIAEFVLAIRHGLGLRKVLGTIHSYPTLTEANRFAAGAWQRAHLPGALLSIAERFHHWRRG
jgi:pyruvate/2-oxoglutarate dehydrogenase complex dihydrolipoamide dehydrogenase (E3) component